MNFLHGPHQCAEKYSTTNFLVATSASVSTVVTASPSFFSSFGPSSVDAQVDIFAARREECAS